MNVPDTDWGRAVRALELFAVAPMSFGGIWLHARPGPARTRFLAHFAELFPTGARITPATGDDALDDDLDLTATLASGRLVFRSGLLSRSEFIVLAMAERCPPGLAARLGSSLDRCVVSVLALDESQGPDEGLPASLADRLSLFVTLDEVAMSDIGNGPMIERIAVAQKHLAAVSLSSGVSDVLVRLADRLGIASLRAPMAAAAAARASAALAGRGSVTDDDLAVAVALTLAHRGQVSVSESEQPSSENAEPPPDDADAESRTSDTLQDEILLDAIRAALPPDLLSLLAAARTRRSAAGSGGAGSLRKGNRRGRPLPSRPGQLDTGARIDLVATLRAAAPLQTIRRDASGTGRLVELRASDIRVRRYQDKSDRLVIFAVDASGSAAVARLAEAKGAIELLLAEAYVRRDHVALVAFRGIAAEVLLPPTRSLVQTRRRLGALPGGGGTPLASGLKAAFDLAASARSRGMTPTIALLTDGRANITLDGHADRPTAEADAARVARIIRTAAIPSLVIDTASRPQSVLTALARELGARYLPLPRANADKLSSALSEAVNA